jgi:hypothetical protein
MGVSRGKKGVLLNGTSIIFCWKKAAAKTMQFVRSGAGLVHANAVFFREKTTSSACIGFDIKTALTCYRPLLYKH